jgi:hypothetical protein
MAAEPASERAWLQASEQAARTAVTLHGRQVRTMVANESLQRTASARGGLLQRAGGLLLGEHARQPAPGSARQRAGRWRARTLGRRLRRCELASEWDDWAAGQPLVAGERQPWPRTTSLPAAMTDDICRRRANAEAGKG